jgi:hypothetical protein
MADELTAEQKKVLADQEKERAYGKFKSWLDRYAEENKPEEGAPAKTTKPSGGILASLFGG